MNYTDKEFERLTEFKDNLYAAKYCGYVRFSSREQKERLAAIYESHFGKKSGILNGCSRCLLNDTKALADLYFNDVKEREEMAKKIQIQSDPEPDEVQYQLEPDSINAADIETVINKVETTKATKTTTKNGKKTGSTKA